MDLTWSLKHLAGGAILYHYTKCERLSNFSRSSFVIIFTIYCPKMIVMCQTIAVENFGIVTVFEYTDLKLQTQHMLSPFIL